MRIFIAGGTGVIGKRVIPALIAAGHEVTALARTQPKAELLSTFAATPVGVDLFDPSAVRHAVAGHRIVINLATRIPPSSRAFLPGAWRANDRIRQLGSRNLVDAAIAAGTERFVQESFAPIYPDRGDEWIDEHTPVRPARYNRSVLEAEGAAERFTRSGGVGVVLRFALFYGADSGYTRDTIRYVRKGWAAALGSPSGFISSLSHDDAAAAVVFALQVRPGTYNVVDDAPVRRREYFDALAAALEVAPPRFPPTWLARVTGPVGETLSRSQRLANGKLKRECGWQPRWRSVREGWPRVVRELLSEEPASSNA